LWAENEATDFAALKRMFRPPNLYPRKRRKTEMLKLLLEEHISPDVAHGLRRRNRATEVHYLVEWEDGHFLGQEDSLVYEKPQPRD
jgi:hypothetical protein